MSNVCYRFYVCLRHDVMTFFSIQEILSASSTGWLVDRWSFNAPLTRRWNFATYRRTVTMWMASIGPKSGTTPGGTPEQKRTVSVCSWVDWMSPTVETISCFTSTHQVVKSVKQNFTSVSQVCTTTFQVCRSSSVVCRMSIVIWEICFCSGTEWSAGPKIQLTWKRWTGRTLEMTQGDLQNAHIQLVSLTHTRLQWNTKSG